MVDWKQSLPQIIGALIGSSLLASGLSGLLRPTVDISVVPYEIAIDKFLGVLIHAARILTFFSSNHPHDHPPFPLLA